jgi:RNA polymerase sigma-70 factor (ECF subfamily)
MTRDDPAISDDELVRLAQREPGAPASRRAVSHLLGRYSGRVYGWCRRFVRNHELALDMSQEVLMNAFRALDHYESRAPFSAWLFVIARRHCIRAMRPRRLIRDEGAQVETLSHPGAGPDELFDERQSGEELLRLMRDVLDPREQEAVWLRYVEHASVEDITRMLGLTTASGARGLMQTARRKLRAAVAGREARRAGGSS